MTDLVVKKGELKGAVTIPSSKSVAHRMIIASVLSRSRSSIYGNLNSKDILATLDCMRTLGAKVERRGNVTEIDATALCACGSVFNVNESGSTMRFLLPLLPVYRNEFNIKGEGRISARPIKALSTAMERQGVKVEKDFLPTNVSGSYNGSDFIIDATESSQYITGLLFTAAALGGGTVEIEKEITSKGYVDITIDVLKKYGVGVDFNNKTFTVKVPNGIIAPKEISVNADWSSACFWIVAGVINGEIELKGLEYPDSQPDSVIYPLIKKMGGNVRFEDGILKVSKSELHAVEFDADGSPDIVPILSVACALADGVSVITGTHRLRLKESDRVKAVYDMLTAVGVKVEVGENYVKIYGTKNIKGGIIDSVNDHRIAMSGMILGTVSDGDTTVLGTECTAKSYPDFIKDFVKLGGKI